MGIATQTQFHVLAVDDSVIDRKLIERLFKISSYHVTTVDSGRKALEFLGLMEDAIMNKNSKPPPCVPSALPQVVEVNLVITDYCMPGMTGYDLLKKIKESSSLKDIPVVIMSSENVPSRISRCLEEGAEEFLLKPVQLSDVNKLKPHLLKGKPREENQFHDQEAELKEELVELLSPRAAEKQSAQQTNSKRKTMDDIPSERTRTRYNDADIDCVRIL